MGSKIITEKDFWICSGGLMPAPMQSTQLVATKKDGNKYITIQDKSTQSFVDFACKKLMWLMALVAAIIAVAVVATGGAALIAIGAIAGAAGAAFGAVLGSLICGQKAAMARVWLGSKSNFKILGTPTVTGDHKMICNIFGEQISYAPNIKNWWQAISLGVANLIGGILEGAMIGAAVGAGGALLKGGMAALAEGGIAGLGRSAFQLIRTLPGNLVSNVISSWTTGLGLGLRGVMAGQHAAAVYGTTGDVSMTDVGKGAVGMETGTYESAGRIFTGQGTAMDVIGLALWFTPIHKAAEGKGGKSGGSENAGHDPAGNSGSKNNSGGNNAPENTGGAENSQGNASNRNTGSPENTAGQPAPDSQSKPAENSESASNGDRPSGGPQDSNSGNRSGPTETAPTSGDKADGESTGSENKESKKDGEEKQEEAGQSKSNSEGEQKAADGEAFEQGFDPTKEPRFEELCKDPQTGEVNGKSVEEAKAILQAENMGHVENPTRPNLSQGEPNLDFKVGGPPPYKYADVKTPIEPGSKRGVDVQNQAAGIGKKTMKQKAGAKDVLHVIDLKNIPPADKGAFKQIVLDNAGSSEGIVFIND